MPATLAPPEEAVFDPLTFQASDVTGARELEFDGVNGHRLARDVAMSVAGAMELDLSLPYGLRDNQRARMLIDEQPLGAQIRPGSKLVVIPKSHLG
jgi:hypothetical protein